MSQEGLLKFWWQLGKLWGWARGLLKLLSGGSWEKFWGLSRGSLKLLGPAGQSFGGWARVHITVVWLGASWESCGVGPVGLLKLEGQAGKTLWGLGRWAS